MKRKANYELLRIISMMLIVILHYFSHGGGDLQIAHGTLAYYFARIITAAAQVGVNCFVLLSSFFLIEKSFSLSRVINTVLSVFFYSVLCLSVYILVSGDQVGVREIVYSLFPITSSQYWFMTQYVLLLFFSPLINAAIANMPEKTLYKTTILFVSIFSLIPTILPWAKCLSSGKNIAWFITLYLIAGCLKKYNSRKLSVNPLYIFFLLSFCTVVFDELFVFFTKGAGGNWSTLLFYNNSPTIAFASIMLMVWAKRIEVGTKLSRCINGLSRGVFSVYLLHDNPITREMMWQQIGKLFIPGEWGFILNIFISIVVIFTVSMCVEFIRRKLFQCLKIEKGIDSFISLIFQTQNENNPPL